MITLMVMIFLTGILLWWTYELIHQDPYNKLCRLIKAGRTTNLITSDDAHRFEVEGIKVMLPLYGYQCVRMKAPGCDSIIIRGELGGRKKMEKLLGVYKEPCDPYKALNKIVED